MASVDDIEELIATRKLNGVDDGLYESDKNVANMTEEAFNEIIDNFEVVAHLTMYGRKGIKENVKKLQSRIKELEEENQRLKAKIDVVNWQEKTAYQCLKENYIPKQKIKDKIEELKIKSQQTYEEFLKSNRLDMNLHCRGIYTDAQIVILKELLEEKKQ